jgi:cytoskeletal protein CcmA (bactofilin family)
VNGGVVADEAVIHGRVHGGVQARTRLALEESAEVEGDVLARRLALKEGGRVNGNIRMGDDVVAAPEQQATS